MSPFSVLGGKWYINAPGKAISRIFGHASAKLCLKKNILLEMTLYLVLSSSELAFFILPLRQIRVELNVFNEKSSDNVYNWQLDQVLQNYCATILLINSFFFFSKSIVIWFIKKHYNFVSLLATLTKWASSTKLSPLWRNNGALPGRQWMRLLIPVFTGTLRHILRSWWGHSHTHKNTHTEQQCKCKLSAILQSSFCSWWLSSENI